jgi:hypothetical protein
MAKYKKSLFLILREFGFKTMEMKNKRMKAISALKVTTVRGSGS